MKKLLLLLVITTDIQTKAGTERCATPEVVAYLYEHFTPGSTTYLRHNIYGYKTDKAVRFCDPDALQEVPSHMSAFNPVHAEIVSKEDYLTACGPRTECFVDVEDITQKDRIRIPD